MSDEIIREVWQIKDDIGLEVNYNLHSLGNFLRQRQKSGNKKIVDLFSKRKVPKRKTSAVSAEQLHTR